MTKKKVDSRVRPDDRNLYVCQDCGNRLDEYLLCRPCIRTARVIAHRNRVIAGYRRSLTYDPDEVL